MNIMLNVVAVASSAAAAILKFHFEVDDECEIGSGASVICNGEGAKTCETESRMRTSASADIAC